MSQNSTVILTDSQESKINISIVGSCVSRDVFGFTVNQQSVGYSVERFVQSVNPVSAVSGLVGAGLVEELVNESEKSEASNFYKRCFKLDVQKNWIDYLSEKKSDWLIIDMSTVSSPVISVDDTYISYNLFCAIRKKFKTLEDESAFAKIGSMSTMDLKNMDEDYLRGVYRRFFDMLMELYPENKMSSEYEYSIRGTATEETCFYLYSFTKNPLGGWRSVVNTIEEGKYMFTTKVASSLESIYIQLVLSNSGKDIKWIGGNLSTRFELTKAYTHQLIRVIINKGVSVDVEGCMILERL